jgi:diguanylate cyclase (GGDEF)-like protein
MKKLLYYISQTFWVLICGLSLGSGLAGAVILTDLPRRTWSASLWHLAPLLAASVLAALGGIYGMFVTVLLGRSRDRHGLAAADLASLQRDRLRLEQDNKDLRRRVDELATLREVAYVVNRETDFQIIAEKTLTLVAALFEAASIVIYLLRDDTPEPDLNAFCQWQDGKARFGRRIQSRAIPNFALDVFDRYGIVVRAWRSHIYVIIPLKVETEVLGAMMITFQADGRAARRLTEELNGPRRVLLHEIAQHISLALKTKHLHTRAVVDGLTRLYTKQHFSEQIEAHIDLARRARDPLSLIAVDIDHFKRVNDTHGHLSGDIVLAGVATRIRNALRKYDSAYRYGGEELFVLLPKTDAEKAAVIAERLRTRVENLRVKSEAGKRIHVTISLGVAQFAAGDTPEALISRADRCLYEAKRGGRNRVVVHAAPRAA